MFGLSKHLRVPGAELGGLLQIGPRQSGTWHEVDVFLGVEAHLFQKWH